MNVTYWSDYACPFCYIGVTHLMKAAEELGAADQIDLTMRAFELDPRAPQECESDTTERFGAKYGLSATQAAARVAEITELAHEAGLEHFDYAATRSTNTFDAHRLTKLAQLKYPELARALEEALYDAYFSKGFELADHAVLRSAAASVGLDAGEVEEVLSSDAYADEVRFDEREAAMRGVHGVPYFVISGRTVIPGCMGVEQLKRVLADELERVGSESAQGGFGMCGPDGCVF